MENIRALVAEAQQAVEEIAEWHGGASGPVHWVRRAEVLRAVVAYALASLPAVAGEVVVSSEAVAGSQDRPPNLVGDAVEQTEPLSPVPAISADSAANGIANTSNAFTTTEAAVDIDTTNLPDGTDTVANETPEVDPDPTQRLPKGKGKK